MEIKQKCKKKIYKVFWGRPLPICLSARIFVWTTILGQFGSFFKTKIANKKSPTYPILEDHVTGIPPPWKIAKKFNFYITYLPCLGRQCDINPYPAKLFYLNFHPLEVVSRYRDPQLQVGENHAYLFNLRSNICKSLCLNTHFVPKNSHLIE